MDSKSEQQGFPESRLPTFTPAEAEELLGSSDFLGINYYTVMLVEDTVADINDISYYADQDTITYQDSNWYT